MSPAKLKPEGWVSSVSERTCPKCKVLKSVSEFNDSKWLHNKAGVEVYCKPCAVVHSAEDRSRNSSRNSVRDSKRRRTPEVLTHKSILDRMRRYGMSQEFFWDMWESQNAQCAICLVDLVITSKTTHVDHCHVTGTVRGILCQACNMVLGHAKDNTDVLLRAVEYLRRER